MTSLSRAVLGSCCAISLGIIGYVHYAQFMEREELHAGVIRDWEKQERMKRKNTYALSRQMDIAKELRKEELTRHET
ncbi:cytochrome c oxidase assembly factor-like [Neodiprion pinetum]|uniref:Protein PET117 homolog, mitochondrial n=1 Tax=Neodiprion lecontei TaxID=441921 RepID=A0A6J0BW98_NEOLC|nr:protein PET117 homolog, mitochondrial [Neodiprion lecontei]XP_046430315.1 protein PET117 homolog, mitochondrial [Neodiprion fabricii]XP_046486898.1 protein PET117 homolog, mitochondrial [Neodiprion pinetum]XP_046625890.1 protein PET117 homolog, mitochondrial [Neodiprion virginianus]